MDVPDIELVIVVGMPDTIGEFYQVRQLIIFYCFTTNDKQNNHILSYGPVALWSCWSKRGPC